MIGLGFTPFETRADVILRLATRADQLGIDRVDVAEGWTHDATILLAEAASSTTRIGLGTSGRSTRGCSASASAWPRACVRSSRPRTASCPRPPRSSCAS